MFDKLPPELRDLGLSPAEIVQAVKDAKELKTKQETMEGELNTTKSALESANNGLTEVRNKLAEIEANPPRRQADPPKQDEDINFLDDPEGAVNQRVARAVGPTALVALHGARNTARMMAVNSLQGQSVETPTGRISMMTLWRKWEKEIDAAAAQVPIGNLGNHETWLNLFNFVKGKHMDEMIAKPGDFVESVQSSTNTRVGESRNDDAKATEEEISIAKRMKVPIEKYMEQKKRMNFQPAA